MTKFLLFSYGQRACNHATPESKLRIPNSPFAANTFCKNFLKLKAVENRPPLSWPETPMDTTDETSRRGTGESSQWIPSQQKIDAIVTARSGKRKASELDEPVHTGPSIFDWATFLQPPHQLQLVDVANWAGSSLVIATQSSTRMTMTFLTEALRRIEEAAQSTSNLKARVAQLEEMIQKESSKVKTLEDQLTFESERTADKEKTIIKIAADRERMRSRLNSLRQSPFRRVSRAFQVGENRFRCTQECRDNLEAINQLAFNLGFTQAIQSLKEMNPDLNLQEFMSCKNFDPFSGNHIDERVREFCELRPILPSLYNGAEDVFLDQVLPDESLNPGCLISGSATSNPAPVKGSSSVQPGQGLSEGEVIPPDFDITRVGASSDDI